MSFVSLLLLISLMHPSSEPDGRLSRALQLQAHNVFPMLIYFSSENCVACAQFDALFDEPETLKKLEQHYVSVRVSINDMNGKACAEIYGIHDVPALVIADQKGIILYRSNATLSVQDIDLLLEAVPGQFSDVNKVEIPATNEIDKNPIITHEIEENVALVNTPEDEPALIYKPSGVVSNTAEERSKTPENVDLRSTEFDQREITSVTINTSPITNSITGGTEVTNTKMVAAPITEATNVKPNIDGATKSQHKQPIRAQRTYSIQLGFFSESPNAQKCIQEAISKGLTETRTVTEQREGKSFYRVLLGSFSTLAEAQALLAQVTSLGIKGAVYRQ